MFMIVTSLPNIDLINNHMMSQLSAEVILAVLRSNQIMQSQN